MKYILPTLFALSGSAVIYFGSDWIHYLFAGMLLFVAVLVFLGSIPRRESGKVDETPEKESTVSESGGINEFNELLKNGLEDLYAMKLLGDLTQIMTKHSESMDEAERDRIVQEAVDAIMKYGDERIMRSMMNN